MPDSDELTPTMKLKRRPIVAKYAAEIDDPHARPRDGLRGDAAGRRAERRRRRTLMP
jgi:hypothetical protein